MHTPSATRSGLRCCARPSSTPSIISPAAACARRPYFGALGLPRTVVPIGGDVCGLCADVLSAREGPRPLSKGRGIDMDPRDFEDTENGEARGKHNLCVQVRPQSYRACFHHRLHRLRVSEASLTPTWQKLWNCITSTASFTTAPGKPFWWLPIPPNSSRPTSGHRGLDR